MLKQMLSQRGLECKGCADKDDYVQMSFSNQHLPILPPPVAAESAPETSEKSKKEADDVSRFLDYYREVTAHLILNVSQ